MGMFNKLSDIKWLSLLTNLVIAAATTIVIVWALPVNTDTNFKFEVGKPWAHGTLIANYKFDIHKSDEAIKEEQDLLLKEFCPYYIMEEDVEEKALADFGKALERDTTGVLKSYRTLIERRLHFLYEQGIMNDQEYNQMANDTTSIIRIVKDKMETPTEISSILPVRRAYDRIFSDEELTEHRTQLAKFNLFNFVRPNLKYDVERNSIERDELLGSVASVVGEVEKDEKIIDRGEIVDAETAQKIHSLEKVLEAKNFGKHNGMSHFWGRIFFVAVFILLFTYYLQIYRKSYFAKPLNIVMLYMLIAAFPIAVSLLTNHPYTSLYILPFALVPMITQVFFDSRTAFSRQCQLSV